ncbi:sugar ABC transporter substrate-binding protein [Bacillus toyonensis]|uniref:sugar ABC transporter substrate-binding protein n=1 Tax=Bacillus toyonensis TaxID=155322 RepID=UPI001C0254B9|nr:sugar ABC transporter substrate-binding protein [Bacillus toyonensis]UFH96745.1 sugar ABC transporter substrate-binding protein [Bacillus toyonensis]HDR7316687.1 sugar ABC transporter substrate-binding protein [Bacillus toyonensis]HDR7479760.1 sugar ABC transporter substrate-binding protein [Bacillus toyonensis]HDR7510706.1 sugar ABC transporter substrate-binding protein [Bacillus toyonensis]HDR7844721.1 sugar ABC transporter substrate-binding protein [Bacillus toyonensis]
MNDFKIHVVLEEVNFLWDLRKVFHFRELWNSNCSFAEIVKELKRKPIEIAVLILDQVDKYKIHKRSIGLGKIGSEKVRFKSKSKLPPYVYITLEEMDFFWKEKDIERFKDLWMKRFSIEDIANRLGRHQIELAALILDQFGLEYMLNSLVKTEKRVS